jgi:hypothetical protein
MHRDARQTGRLSRWLLRALGCVLGAALVVAGLAHALERADLPVPAIQADVAIQVQRSLERVRAARERGETGQMLVLGDSMLLPGSGERPGRTLSERLARLLRPGTARAPIHTIAVPGGSYTTFYFFAGEIAASRPEQVVIELNPAAFAKTWRTGNWARTDLVGWLGAERVPEALTLPLERLAITTDELLWKVACVELGAAPVWAWLQRQQLGVAALRDRASKSLSVSTGWRARLKLQFGASMGRLGRERLKTTPPRMSAEGHRNLHSDALAGIPSGDVSIELLAATVRELSEAGASVFVYITPINVEHMRGLGLYDEQGFRTTARHNEQAVVAAGGRFLDLHDLLPDAAFRDAPGHLTNERPVDGAEILARRLASELRSPERPQPRTPRRLERDG